ncbi:GntR family transcriptional regulator [Primorskyibacter marinus]|uniref:GntR family transcriptional regulator n=1 Tax=Primorskyibacter marinus TaxID=1977320 RepID=UPI000E303C80|nr:GntR family transcriptional regulator [Primorskyibacter marinus]
MTDNSLAEKIATSLRRDILRGALAPGAQIKERDSAQGMGVSRTPMREAIRILAKEGLVMLRASRSPVVADPSLKEVTDAIVVLAALETLSGKLACRNATDQDIANIRGIHEHFVKAYDHVDTLDLFEIDMSFHLAIASASHNTSLADTHRSYLERLWRARFLSARRRRARDRVLKQHGEIIAGLEARDVIRVTGQIEQHLEHLVLNIETYFEERASEEASDAAKHSRDDQPRKEEK